MDVLAAGAALGRTLGQFSLTISLLEQAIALDPLNLSSLKSLAFIYVKSGRYGEGIEASNRLLALNPEYPGGHMLLSRAYLLKGDPQRALIEINMEPTSISHPARLAMLYYTLGDEAQSQALIKQMLEKTADKNPGPMVPVYAWRGENDLAFEWLEITLRQHDWTLSTFLGNEWMRGLVSDPRYPVMAEKPGLLEAWKAMPPEHGGPPKQPRRMSRLFKESSYTLGLIFSNTMYRSWPKPDGLTKTPFQHLYQN